MVPSRDPAAAFAEPALMRELTALAAEASHAILRFGPPAAGDVRAKADASPVTGADEAAEAVILAGLARLLPGIAVASEEAGIAGPLLGPAFVLVDPLDGTREFIAGRAEYTVNIAIVAGGEPVAGVVAAPALGLIWRGARGRGAERLALTASGHGKGSDIRTRPWPAAHPVALTSRSHPDAATEALIGRIHGVVREVCGSSLKFCRLAEGRADIYPRLAPTREWDLGAGHAVLVAAGGAMRTPDGAAIAYGRTSADLLVPGFIAMGDRSAAPPAAV